jgi:hypothetical protein
MSAKHDGAGVVGMSDRLRPRDLAFLEQENATTPRHNATVEVFDPGDPGESGGAFDYDRFVALILDRISFVPRYRQRVQLVPGHLANPVWVDDDHFDIGYHVRRSALPRPGSTDQLRELVARIVSRPLDRGRLWRDHPPPLGCATCPRVPGTPHGKWGDRPKARFAPPGPPCRRSVRKWGRPPCSKGRHGSLRTSPYPPTARGRHALRRLGTRSPCGTRR